MTQLKDETQKSSVLQQKLSEFEKSNTVGVFGDWMADMNNINFKDKDLTDNLILQRNSMYESQLKSGLDYFHKKFRVLFEKMTEFTIQTTDQENKWAIQEENYKAEIENLKTQLNRYKNDDESDLSPGAIEYNLDGDTLKRKCEYLKESYKYIRTLNENIKNEYLDYKRQSIIQYADYENEIQTLILKVATLSDKLRNSISLEIFLEQNKILQDCNVKYKKLLEKQSNDDMPYTNLYKQLEEARQEVISNYHKESKYIDSIELVKVFISIEINIKSPYFKFQKILFRINQIVTSNII